MTRECKTVLKIHRLIMTDGTSIVQIVIWLLPFMGKMIGYVEDCQAKI